MSFPQIKKNNCYLNQGHRKLVVPSHREPTGAKSRKRHLDVTTTRFSILRDLLHELQERRISLPIECSRKSALARAGSRNWVSDGPDGTSRGSCAAHAAEPQRSIRQGVWTPFLNTHHIYSVLAMYQTDPASPPLEFDASNYGSVAF